MEIVLRPIQLEDGASVMEIFNYYVEHSFAAYPETPLPRAFFETFLKMSEGYPTAAACDAQGGLVGFGMLRSYHPLPVFSQTAEITYFLRPEYTGKGVGKRILSHLTELGKLQGITTILASISSLNEGSLRFHEKNGFEECGRFRGVGRKHGHSFDVVYCQKRI